MASTLRLPPLTFHLHLTRATPPTPRATSFIRCGPRSNRGPLVKGRVLSSEAILAIQSLKRAHKSSGPNSQPMSNTLSRLIKSDLLATLRELLRQDQCTLALQVFSAVRLEPWYNTDFALYADLVLALSRNDMWQDIDRLIEGLEMEMEGGHYDIKWDDKKGLGRLLRAVIAADRRQSTVRIYRVMKRYGWGVSGSGVVVDEYVGNVLSKGLRRFGDVELADEVDLVVQNYLSACLGRV